MNSPDYIQGLRDAADLVEKNSWNTASDMRNAKELGAGLAKMLRWSANEAGRKAADALQELMGPEKSAMYHMVEELQELRELRELREDQQPQKCLRGEHNYPRDPEGIVGGIGVLPSGVGSIRGTTVYACRHCRCLYVERT